MSQAGIINVSGQSGVVDSVQGTAPIQVNGVSGTPETGAVTDSVINATTSSVGVASFNPAQFTVTSGAVSLIGGSGAPIETITGDSGGPLGPTSGNFNLTGGTTGLTFSGATSTETLTGTLVVANGGTDSTSFNTNGAVYSNTTSTGALQAASLTDGQILVGSTIGAPTAATITAGANISIANGHNSITISASTASESVNYTNVSTSPYVVLSTDYYLSVDCSAGAITLNFPNIPAANRIWVIKDRTGSAATNNITITTVGGLVNIDGAATYVMKTNYQAVQMLANSVPTYEIY
jgi:hypothetical protein